MDILGPLTEGLKLLSSPPVVILAILGTCWGLLAGALPGIGSPVAVSVMLPFTFLMNSTQAIAFLVAISIATGYGNSIPAVLVGVPGTASAFLTSIDGYALHRRGQSGLGLGAAYFGTVTSQWVGILLFTIMVVPLSRLPYHFLGPELFALYMLGLAAVVSLTGKNVVKGLIAAAIGISVSIIGRDPISGIPRFDFGIAGMREGLEIVPVAIGVIALGELLRNMRQVYSWGDLSTNFSIKFPGWKVYKTLLPATMTGSVIGTFIGAIPGLGSVPATMVSYQQAKFFSKKPWEFGNGSIEGIAANEAGGSSANAGELVPTLGLGVPGSTTGALLLGALTIHGLVPGPLLLQQTPELLHAAIAGGVAGTIFVGLTGAVIAKKLLRLALMDRSVVLVGAIFVILVGIYAVRRSMFDVAALLLFGAVGYCMYRYGYSPAAFALGLILGRGIEGNLRRGLVLTDNDPIAFVTRPYTLPILLLALAFLSWGVYSTWKVNQRETDHTGEDVGEGGDDVTVEDEAR